MTTNIQEVQLPLIDYKKFYDSFKDPQPVCAKKPTSAWIYINTDSLTDDQPRNNFTVALDKDGNRVEFARETSRLSPVGVAITNWFIPNCNPRNNAIVFFSSVTGLRYTAFIPEGLYTTSLALTNAMVLAMNGVGSGITFSAVAIPLFPDTYTLVGTANFYITADCNIVKKGQALAGIAPSEILAISRTIGPMGLKYTDYVDVHSKAITQYQKLRSITTEGKSGLVLRAYLGPEDNWGNRFYSSFLLQNLSFAFRANAVLNAIDIQLYDDNGDFLYIPPYLERTLSFQLTLQAEL
jgi:hypothetical protein